jgi:YhcH/YjgK/YiaL family protein
MIINSLKNISIYTSVYPHLKEAVNFIQNIGFDNLVSGKNDVSDNVFIMKNQGEKKSDFTGILEVHREWIDIHIPLTDDEIIAFKEISECKNLIKEYDSENDYALYDEEDISQLTLAKGYFAIIDPTVAHMAMLGEGSMSKLVFKIRK